MTDIVDRMGEHAEWFIRNGDEYTGSMISKAAGEIERLRKDNAGLLILVDMTRDAAMGYQERAEMLRAALVKIAETAPLIGRCSVIARVALLEDSCD